MHHRNIAKRLSELVFQQTLLRLRCRLGLWHLKAKQKVPIHLSIKTILNIKIGWKNYSNVIYLWQSSKEILSKLTITWKIKWKMMVLEKVYFKAKSIYFNCRRGLNHRGRIIRWFGRGVLKRFVWVLNKWRELVLLSIN